MSLDDGLLLAHAVSTAWLAGIVWTVQLVVYPAAVSVVVTAGVSVPMHLRLTRGWDDAAWHRLVRTNWWRTSGWTAGAGCAAGLLVV